MPSVLFVCTANQFRSPLAAALFNKTIHEIGAQDSWIVGSAGTWATPGQPALPSVLAVAQNYGLDLSSHRSARLDESLLSAYDLILVMQASHKEALLHEFPACRERIYLFSKVVEGRSYDIPDLAGSIQGVADVCADLEDLIRRGLHSICVLATYLYNSKYQSEIHDE